MRLSVDEVPEHLTEDQSHLPFEERLDLMLRLGEERLERFRQENALPDLETARREWERRRQAGRTPSKCISDLIG